MKFRAYLLVYSTPLKEKNPSHTYSNCLTVVHHISPYSSTPYAHIYWENTNTQTHKRAAYIYIVKVRNRKAIKNDFNDFRKKQTNINKSCRPFTIVV